MADPNANAIVDQLIEKTTQGRLSWREAADKGKCSLALGEFTFLIERAELEEHNVVRLAIEEKEGHLLWDARARSGVAPVGPGGEGTLFRKLSALFEMARNQALQLDRKLARIADLLDHA